MAYKHFTNSVKQLRGDPRFNNRIAAKFINCMMWEGKKSVAQRVFYNAMERISETITDVPPGNYQLTVWHELLGTIDRPVTVPAGGVTIVNIDVPAVAPLDDPSHH